MNDERYKHYVKFVRSGIHFDGRKLTEYRPISVEYGVSVNAEGSARVRIGETDVIAGVKMSLETPYADTPEEGNLMIGAELLPMSNPEFEPGPPGSYAIEIARVVDRAVRESKAIDNKALCVEQGGKVWSVMVDICTINDAGNIFDAAALATIAAIRNVKFPKLKEDGSVDYKDHTDKSLPLSRVPMSITVLKVGGVYLVDPASDEEELYDARLTVGCTEDGIICSMQKGGDGALTTDDISAMVDLAIEKSQELRSKL